MDTGWLTADAARNIVYGDTVWSSPDLCRVSDDAYASASVAVGMFSDGLNAYTYGVSVPNGSTILGIEMRVERAVYYANTIKDENIHLMDGVNAKGSNKADTGTYWPSADAEVVYGGSSDLWGASWTAAQVNAAAFGAGVRCENCGDFISCAYVDCIQVKIHYAISGTDHLMIMGM